MHAMQGVKPAKARTETAKLIRACAKTVQSAECKVLHLECGYQATEFWAMQEHCLSEKLFAGEDFIASFRPNAGKTGSY